jgi:hypothetical protein
LACENKSSAKPSDGEPTNAASNSGASNPWKDARAPFEVTFFGEPQVKFNERDADGMHVATLSASANDAKRLLLAVSITMTKVPQYDCKVGLDGMVRKSTLDLGCNPKSQSEITLSGISGREVHFDCANPPQIGILRVYCDDSQKASGRVADYSALAAYGAPHWDESEARRFLDSFKLVSQKE